MLLKYITRDSLNLMLGIGTGIGLSGLMLNRGIGYPLYLIVLGFVVVLLVFALVYLKKKSQSSHSGESDKQ